MPAQLIGAYQIDWKLAIIAAMLIDRFLNNLVRNCPFLEQNVWYQLFQGVFDALVQTLQGPGKPKDADPPYNGEPGLPN
jgi:hypothetical protein